VFLVEDGVGATTNQEEERKRERGKREGRDREKTSNKTCQ
jgi:hypothetical protein